MKQALLFGAVATILSTGALADTQTVTTQDYVDTRVETKQDKITGRGTESTYGIPRPASAIIDTDTNGVVAKQAILYGDTNNGWLVNPATVGEALVVGNLLTQAQTSGMKDLFGYSDDDMKNALVSADMLMAAFASVRRRLDFKQQKKVCVRWLDGAAETDENCLLWNLP